MTSPCICLPTSVSGCSEKDIVLEDGMPFTLGRTHAAPAAYRRHVSRNQCTITWWKSGAAELRCLGLNATLVFPPDVPITGPIPQHCSPRQCPQGERLLLPDGSAILLIRPAEEYDLPEPTCDDLIRLRLSSAQPCQPGSRGVDSIDLVPFDNCRTTRAAAAGAGEIAAALRRTSSAQPADVPAHSSLVLQVHAAPAEAPTSTEALVRTTATTTSASEDDAWAWSRAVVVLVAGQDLGPVRQQVFAKKLHAAGASVLLPTDALPPCGGQCGIVAVVAASSATADAIDAPLRAARRAGYAEASVGCVSVDWLIASLERGSPQRFHAYTPRQASSAAADAKRAAPASPTVDTSPKRVRTTVTGEDGDNGDRVRTADSRSAAPAERSWAPPSLVHGSGRRLRTGSRDSDGEASASPETPPAHWTDGTKDRWACQMTNGRAVGGNKRIVSQLEELQAIYKSQGDSWREYAYRKAATIFKVASEVRDVSHLRELDAEGKLPGVGKKILQKVEEMLEDGKAHRLEVSCALCSSRCSSRCSSHHTSRCPSLCDPAPFRAAVSAAAHAAVSVLAHAAVSVGAVSAAAHAAAHAAVSVAAHAAVSRCVAAASGP